MAGRVESACSSSIKYSPNCRAKSALDKGELNPAPARGSRERLSLVAHPA